jgi:tRNA threonylcarbamoyladenosine biosynthesis protein TsaB
VSRARFVLGIDTAGRSGSIALAENGSALVWEPLVPGEHSSGLSRAGERILSGRGLTWSELEGVAVSSGPGSFTGLRIGLAWAKGICMGSGARLLLVSSHEVAAHYHREEGGLIGTVLQGERGQVQAALWSAADLVTPLWGPEPVPEGELPSALLAAAAPVRAADDSIGIAGTELRPQLVETLLRQGFRLLDAEIRPPGAPAVAELGDRKLLRGEEADLVRSAPAYGRAPNARKPSP